MSVQRERFLELDLWRGLAVVAMIVFHVFFFLNYFGFITIAFGAAGWKFFARTVQWSFFLLVGIGLHLSYQHHLRSGKPFSNYLKKLIRRSLIVFSSALLVTLFTGITFPQNTIYFGALHFIAVSIVVVGLLIVPRPKFAPFLALLLFVASQWIRAAKTSSIFLMPLGFDLIGFHTFDYFPIFPWMAIPMLGVFLGSVLYPKGSRPWRMPFIKNSQQGVLQTFLKPIIFAGQHALVIYLLHAPIIVALLYSVVLRNL